MQRIRIPIYSAVLALACNGALPGDDQSAEVPMTAVEKMAATDHYPTPNEDVPQGNNTSPDSWGEPLTYDDGEPTDAENKNFSLIEVHGWSLKGHVALSGTHTGSIIPDVTSVSNASGFLSAQRGRCGRFDGFVDNSWYPCLVPNAPAGTKTWSWRFDQTGCGNDASQKSIAINAIAAAFAVLATDSGWHFPQVSSGEKITIYCTTGAETQLLENATSGGAIAAAYPSGAFTYRLSTPNALDDQCEDPAGAGSPGFPTGADYYWFVDEFYTYDHARVALAWADLWNYINVNCFNTQPAAGFSFRAIASVVTHEMGHVLGFQHQSDTTSDNNVMFATRTCGRLNGTQHFRKRMLDTIYDFDFPHTTGTLQAYDEDLACYSPL